MQLATRTTTKLIRPQAYGIAAVILLGLIGGLMPPDGQERSSWMLFMGRFHLLAIHFPIALLYLVPILEFAGRFYRLPHLKASVEFVLLLAFASSFVAAALGWSLARSGSYSGRIVTQHMWGGILVAAGIWLCWMLRARLVPPLGMMTYTLALAATVVLVSWTGYRGGQLSQGENHLTEGMPTSLRALFGITESFPAVAIPNRNTFYGGRVEPILAANCYSCHSARKQRGKLRLDSYALIMRGGKHSKVIAPGDVKGSELIRRIRLPQNDNDAMPPQGKRALTENEIKTIETWIAADASETIPLNGVKGSPAVIAALPKDVVLPEYRPGDAETRRAAHAGAVAEAQKKHPGILDYESRSSEKLSLNASLIGDKFGDIDLIALKPLIEDITTADLSNTSVSDRSADILAGMKNVQSLQLAHTKVTDASLEKLDTLPALEVLNLLGTAVTSKSLKPMAHLSKLQHVYVANTKITPAAADTPKLKKELIF
jgi:uncharacterized membrane protein